MSDLLAIVGPDQTDEQLLAEIERRHPDRVIILVEEPPGPWTSDDAGRGRAVSDRVAILWAAIERRTGAVVVGLARSREQLKGWRFDRIVGGPGALTA